MKPYTPILCVLSLSPFILFSQKLSEIDTLKYENMISKSQNKNFKAGMDINVYIASDENLYKIGDTLVLGNPTGESPTIFSKKRDFAYVFYGKPGGALLKGIRYVEEDYKSYKLVIDKIQYNKGSLGLENYIYFYVKPLPNTKFTLIDKYITITMVDNAIIKGEIIPLRRSNPLSREEAIELLHKKKEELDLDIITKSQYDSLKETLMPIINENQ